MSEKDTGTPRTDGNGKAKTLTKAERARLAKSIAVARAKRLPGKSNNSVSGGGGADVH